MSSVHSYIRQTNTLFTNNKNMLSTIFLSDGTTNAPWVSSAAAVSAGYFGVSTAGSAVFRDMGKLVYRPSPDRGLGAVSSIFRKVQLVPQGATLQTGQGVGTDANGLYYVGYVSVGGVDGVSGGLVRIN